MRKVAIGSECISTANHAHAEHRCTIGGTHHVTVADLGEERRELASLARDHPRNTRVVLGEEATSLLARILCLAQWTNVPHLRPADRHDGPRPHDAPSIPWRRTV